MVATVFPHKKILNFFTISSTLLTNQLQTQFSQLPNGQISKFQCPSDAEFPEFSDNGLTFDHSPFLIGVMVKKTVAQFF